MGLEILEQCPDVGTVFVPVGGGGMASGVAAAIKLSKPSVRIVAVEPSGAPKMTKSLEAGHPITLPSSKSIADGLMNLRPGDITFAHIRAFVDEVVTVSEESRRLSWLWRRTVRDQVGYGRAAGSVVDLTLDQQTGPPRRAAGGARPRSGRGRPQGRSGG